MAIKGSYHHLSGEEVVRLLHTDSRKGLDNSKVESRRKEFGRNKLPGEKPISQLKIFLDQFKSLLIYILVFAGVITLLLGEYTDSTVIFVAVIVNSIVGYLQESKSSKTLEELKKILTLKAVVIRNGRELEILAEELVPGDLILIKSGDKVPADARLIETNNLKINESALTGEWLAADKNSKILPEDTPLADRDNTVYMGTTVEDGWGKAVVTGIGVETEIGRITTLVRETKEGKTPYQIKVANFSRIIGVVLAVICFGIFIEGMLTGGEFVEMLTTAVAVAVSSIPEGLPIAMTVILTTGMQKIFRKKGLIRKLSAVETLGSTTVIATDKTATLTEGKMTVAGVFAFSKAGQNLALKNAILCSEAFIENPDEDHKKWQVRGMPTERALVLAGVKENLLKNDLESAEPKVGEIPFSSRYKYSASLRKTGEDQNKIYVKGAPEVILEKSKYLLKDGQKVEMTEKERDSLNGKFEELTGRGYRVLGTAYREVSPLKSANENLLGLVDKLIFTGFIYLEDPIRPGVRDAILTCYRAGMRPIMVTGDHRLTAKAIADKIGLNVKDENIIEGADFEKMTDEEFDNRIESIQIYARLEPKHKIRIVKALQKRGEVVAMTGDGVNDAPALKQADIGVALGSGTEVAKEASDLVLLTDDFSIIVSAVEEGRAILDNIRKIITYLLSDSFTEIILVSASILAGVPLPVTAVQILWINLIGDGLPNIALAFDPKEEGLMEQKPQPRSVPLLTKEMKIIIFAIGFLTDLMLLGLFFFLWNKHYDLAYIRTVVFAGLAIDSIFYVFSCKSLKRNLWNINLTNNKLLIGAWLVSVIAILTAIYLPLFNKFLGTVPLQSSSWLVILGLALVNTVLIELAKYYFISKYIKPALST